MKQFARVVLGTIAVMCAACGTSDEAIATSVRAKLAAVTTIDASQVTVAAKNQVVTLSGTVATGEAREEAVRVARETSDVRDVVDQLQVRQAAGVPITPDRPAATSAQAPVAPATSSAPESGAASVETTASTAPKESDSAVVGATKATGEAIVGGAKVAGDATVKGTKVAADATVDAAKATGNATVKGAEATASGAKKLGGSIAGAVTPDKK